MTRVLLTGASGFIGRHCIRGLLEKGYEIHAVSSAGLPPTDRHIQWHRADLLDRKQLRNLVEIVCPDVLLHLAWYTVPGKYWTAQENLWWLQSGIDLLVAFTDCGGKRAVMAGTCAEYDWNFGYCREDLTPTRPVSLYGTCKNALYLVVSQLAAQRKLSLAWGRVFHLYGPHEPPARLIPSIIRGLLRGEPVACGDARLIRDYSHVQDIADAFVELLASNVEGPVNIASGQAISMRSLGCMLEQLLDKRGLVRWNAIPAREHEPPLLAADTRRLNDTVGWVPRFSIGDGLQHAVEWWRTAAAKESG